MAHMQRTKEERKEAMQSHQIEEPKYPYGLRISLGEEELKKLGLDGVPETGKKMKISGQVEIVGSHSSDTKDGGKHREVMAQITHLDMDEGESNAEKLYKKKGEEKPA